MPPTVKVARNPARNLLMLSSALLHVALMASSAASGLPGLGNDLLRLLRLGVVVRLPRLAFGLDEVGTKTPIKLP